MEFFETIIKRRSVRAFKKEPIEEWKINRLLEAANLAPSAGDLQAYEIIVVKDDDRKRRLSEAALGQDFIAEAPVVFVFLSNPKRSARRYGKRGMDLYCLQDATIAAAYLQLAATALGLGSVWVGAFNDDEVSECVSAGELKPVAIIPVGYPDEEPMITPRRGVNNMAHSEIFGQPYQYKPTDKMFLRPQY
ncbi:MAG: nitroreductase family protein [Nitrososphaeria archaeon]